MGLSPAQQRFYDAMYPLAVDASQRTGINADLIFAQAALESAWGQSAPGNNFFGIKGSGAVNSTLEYINGKWVTVKAAFKKYTSMSDSVDSYVSFMGTKRYAGVRNGATVQDQLAALGSSGYATDPGYTGKLASIMASLPSGGGLLDSVKGVLNYDLGTPIANALDSVNPFAALLNGEVAARITAVVIGVILVGLAIAAFLLTSDAGKQALAVAKPI